jgi:cytochrome b pre-mRNA-processing protein 3
VAQARNPASYRDLGVPDTPEARLEMLLLYLAPVLLRLRLEGAVTERLARALIKAFVSDMDARLREMGIGDLSVPRHVKKAVAALYDRIRDYRRALAGGARPALLPRTYSPERRLVVRRHLRP